MDAQTVSAADVWQARVRLKDRIQRTPLLYSDALSRRAGAQIYLKMECWQTCGCFKVRGATNMVAALSEAQRQRGLVTASSGNHGIALAYAAGLFGRPATWVVLPTGSDQTKVAKLTALGAVPIMQGSVYQEAYDWAQAYARDTGATYVHSHGHPLIIAGQGTVGLEIMEDLPEVETILVPIGGGGLIAGIATAARSASDTVRIVGVEPSAAPAAYLSLRDGHCYDRIETRPSVADGLLGGFGRLPFEIARRLVAGVAVVEEDEIIQAMRVFQEDEQLMVEGASSVGLAAILSGKVDVKDQRVVLVVTSRNIDAGRYNQIVNRSS